MSTNPNKPTGSDHHEKGTAESRPDDAALINRYSDFTRFSVQTAVRGYRAMVAADTALALAGIDALASVAEAWSRALRRAGLNPELARSAETMPVDLTALWNANLEISRKWATDVTRAWTQAASVFVEEFEPKGK